MNDYTPVFIFYGSIMLIIAILGFITAAIIAKVQMKGADKIAKDIFKKEQCNQLTKKEVEQITKSVIDNYIKFV